jgi:adenosylcobinamide-phosphate synthase
MFATLALIALAFEAALGYPDALYRRIAHPVTWLGALIAWCDRHWNCETVPFGRRRLRGLVAVAVLVAVALLAGSTLRRVTFLVAGAIPGMLLTAAAASSLLAQRSLHAHVAAVARALESDGLEASRRAVAKIVGRDPDRLDAAGVSRAAIESLAENFSDGVVAPLFWLVVAGLPGALAYKAVNTADSMIGHRSQRHLAFGWAAARTDDLLNLPASRLAALWLVLAASLSSLAGARRAVRAVVRDARRHRSPNAGWPEAAMAGALGLKLAGPRVYQGELVNNHFMGDGRAEATAQDVCAALRLYCRASMLQAAAVAVLAVAVTL